MTNRLAAYRGDADLRKRLESAHAFYSLPELRDLVRSVNAAPPAHDPQAWMALVASEITEDLAEQLSGFARVLDAEPLPEPTDFPARLARLRQEMGIDGLAGLVIPHHDIFHTEEIPDASQRLSFITGFEGSAGLAVILEKRAALFVDGRYTLQARGTTSPDLFEILEMKTATIRTFIETHLPAGGKVGYDPWLMSEADLDIIPQGCATIATHGNLVDRIWEARPPEPIAPVILHDPAFSGETTAEKMARMAAIIRKQGFSSALVTQMDSLAWLFNIRGGDVPYAPLVRAFAILHAEGRATLFIDRRKLSPGVEVRLGEHVDIQPISRLEDMMGQLPGKILAQRTITPIALAKSLGQGTLVWGDDPCQLAKATKNTAEQEGARRAHLRDGEALCQFMAWFTEESGKNTLNEGETARVMRELRSRQEFFRGESFAPICAFGPHATMPHYHTDGAGAPIAGDGLFLMDTGGQYIDGTTDVTRTLPVGTPNEAMKADYTNVLKGLVGLSSTLFPQGTSGLQLDALARKALWHSGVDYAHGTGHGVGSYLGVHEGPARISKSRADQALLPGMLLSCEPGCYRENAYGIRIENILLVIAQETLPGWLGFETLTMAPFARELIRTDMLDASEVAWIDAYHARVAENLMENVPESTRAWLHMATRPLMD